MSQLGKKDPRCLDADCPKSESCARFVSRKEKAVKHRPTMRSEGRDCFFYIAVASDPTEFRLT